MEDKTNGYADARRVGWRTEQMGGLAMAERLSKAVITSGDAAALFAAYKNKRQEHFLLATLNAQHQLIKTHVIAIGTATKTVVSMREIFYPAILDNAVALIAAHNHPSGSTVPSEEDDDLTRRFFAAGMLLGFRVLDHIIVAKNGFYSYKQDARMEDVQWENVLAAELNISKMPPSSTS
jgi:DNA repair protein RadC